MWQPAYNSRVEAGDVATLKLCSSVSLGVTNCHLSIIMFNTLHFILNFGLKVALRIDYSLFYDWPHIKTSKCQFNLAMRLCRKFKFVYLKG
jgi:hypothetical protein